ncbi:cytochrome c biogenesis protein CcsA [Pseudomonas fluorescens]|uniref:cytochrome c biogenesis protein CcsA n=1 Tax=Pseudomonas fluorescens TaxID=294 RepID=UPI000308EC10|nr:cytochrome c biogenesis protein CcsA [Pseudomonas fluorescens]
MSILQVAGSPRWVWVSAVIVLTVAALHANFDIGNPLLWITGTLTFASTFLYKWRKNLLNLATGVLIGECIALALALGLDRFEIRYVWLYSSEGLPFYLKLANVWGGDEGTILLLATLCMPAALRFADADSVEGRFSPLIPAWYILTTAMLGPFTPTPVEWQASQSSQGMNAHLQTFWMALHAPLILGAYAWALASAPSAIQALINGCGSFRASATLYGRRAWLVLTAGIGFGMIWALEDFTFGQLWHWDPVQTSAFILWALLGAVLHGVRTWKVDGSFAQALPVLSLVAAASACLAMAITRSEVLASSHRYIGTTSWMSHLFLAVLLVLLALGLVIRNVIDQKARTQAKRRTAFEIWLSVYGFVFAALFAIFGLAQAHFYAAAGALKPDSLRPFFETLSNWASSAEMSSLRQAFARWDVDGHTLGSFLLPIILTLGLTGSHVFICKTVGRNLSRTFTLIATFAVALVGYRGGYLSYTYEGSGVLSQTIVSVIHLIDAALVAGVFLLLSSLLWCVTSVWRSRRVGALRYTGSLALIHGGAVFALVGGLAATVLNSYVPVLVPPTDDPSQWHTVGQGMELRVSPESNATNFSGYKAVANVEIRQNGVVLAGRALFQDARSLPPGYQGPVRQLCELLDYRYARHAGDRGYLLHPFIVRSWASDMQVWVPASPKLMDSAGTVGAENQTLVVVRHYPLVSLVWGGFILMLLGMLLVPKGQVRF